MIPLPLMLAAADAPAMTPVEAERAFAADAQTIGQWTAFRKWSTDDATMFVPQPVKAHEFLKDREDPPKAIDWWPTASYISCDGKLAVNTGGWKTPDGGVGYFTTVWAKQADGSWKWIVDGGDGITKSRDRPAIVKSRRASCTKASPGIYTVDAGESEAHGESGDHSLRWQWTVKPDGARRFDVWLLTDAGEDAVVSDNIAAAK